MFKLKRVYEPPDPADGKRILVERLWPRGLSKEKARVDEWIKEIAPSPQLRRWYAHQPAKWEEFRRRYRAELETNVEALERLRRLTERGPVTFVFASRDAQRCSAVVLKEFLEK